MITKSLAGFALTLLVAGSAAAQSAAGSYLALEPESRLWVEGTSTVRSFSCAAAGLSAMVEVGSDRAVDATLAGEKAVRSARLEVPARTLDCSNGTMNSHMLKAIAADQHPTIVFVLSSYELADTGDGAAATLTGRLLLGGRERPITMQADLRQGPGGTLRVSGVQEVRLSDHGLKPPSLMMGTMKVGDAVRVHYDLVLKP